MTVRVSTGRWTPLALVSALAFAGPALAQTAGKGFLLGAPHGALAIRGGVSAPTAGGDVLGDATRLLTLRRGDFVGAAVAADAGIALPGGRVEIVLGTGLAVASAHSEYRDWVDNDDQPITQVTSFRRVPITAGLKAYVTPRGRSFGRFAWVPARFAPYAGAGAGLMWYRFRQEGDFVDFETSHVHADVLETSGWGPTAYAGAGADFTLSPHVALTADARYQYGRARPDAQFAGYERVDLSGVTTTLGLNFRF